MKDEYFRDDNEISSQKIPQIMFCIKKKKNLEKSVVESSNSNWIPCRMLHALAWSVFTLNHMWLD